MAINKSMRAALKTLSYMEPDVKNTYRVQRALAGLAARFYVSPPSWKIWDHAVYNGDYPVPVRIFPPRKTRQAPQPDHTLIFFHGGGWVTGNIDTYERICVTMARQTGYTVVAVDYRLAPEYAFPAAVEDCYAVTREIFLRHLRGADPSQIVLIGDSAGGNLAAAVSLMARDRGEFLPQRQILIYPATYWNHGDRSPFLSVRQNGTDYLLTSRRVQEYLELYTASDRDLSNPYFAPLMSADFSRQPKTLVLTAEYCPLRDEGEFYGERLKVAGNAVSIYRMPDALHGFFSLPWRFEHVKTAYAVINRFLREETES